MISPQNRHISNSMQTKQAIFRNICECMYRHTITKGKRAHEFERGQRKVYGEFGGRIGEGEM